MIAAKISSLFSLQEVKCSIFIKQCSNTSSLNYGSVCLIIKLGRDFMTINIYVLCNLGYDCLKYVATIMLIR